MGRFDEYMLLIYGETAGWLNGKRIVRERTAQEYAVLLSLLGHWKTRLRWLAADLLGKLGDPQAVKPLIVTLNDPHWLVRLHAAKALGRIGDPLAIEPLLGVMQDENVSVRRRATAALGMFDDERAVDAVASALAGDPDGVVRVNALRVFCSKGASFVSLLSSAVQDQDLAISWQALVGLSDLGSDAVDYLERLAFDADPEVRYRAVKMLGRSGDRRAARVLKKSLRDENERVRAAAQMALNQIDRLKRGTHAPR